MGEKVHKPHPKCECGRPLFKSFEKGGRVLKTDPYKFCRNTNCEKSGPEGTAEARPEPPKPKPKRPPTPPQEPPKGPPVRARASRLKPRPKPKPIPQKPQKPEEHPGVAAARAKIQDLVRTTSAGAPASAIGLVLALVTQETGNKAAANALIKEHKLDEIFGLQAQ